MGGAASRCFGACDTGKQELGEAAVAKILCSLPPVSCSRSDAEIHLPPDLAFEEREHAAVGRRYKSIAEQLTDGNISGFHLIMTGLGAILSMSLFFF